MRVPLEWLREFVPVALKAEALAERLTMAGMEVTAIHAAEGSPVLEIEITPNRADWLSMMGVAREVAAVTGERLKMPKAAADRAPAAKQAPARIVLEDDDCPYYIGRVLTGVRIAPSPAWMQQRLNACGIRPINNVVDITNYVLLECGQPLHAFDLQKLHGATIRVRRAAADEPITTLEGKTHRLGKETLIIADAARPVAIAGVMGGQDSAVTEATTTVLLESALFEPRTVRRTARRLGLQTESSYRFERGVDPEGIARASQRAAALIAELAQGREIAVIAAGRAPVKRTMISLQPRDVERRLGLQISEPTLRTLLAKLGCRVASRGGSGPMQVTPPSFRRDLAQEVDLIEEVARIGGYDRLPATLPTVTLSAAKAPDANHRLAQALRRQAVASGLTEVITWSLLSAEALRRCRMEHAVRLKNPLSQDQSHLRPSLLPGMLAVARQNIAQGAVGLSLFEIGRVFEPRQPGFHERASCGLLLWGAWSVDWQTRLPADFFRLKSLVDALATLQGGHALGWETASVPWTAAGQGASVALQGRKLGHAGQVAADILATGDIETPVWFAELDLTTLGAVPPASVAAQAPTVVPPVKRDISFLVSAQTGYAAIAEVIRKAGEPLAAHIQLIDRYSGKQVPPGQSSLTFSIAYQDPARTLTAAEADAVHQRISQTLVSQLGATLR